MNNSAFEKEIRKIKEAIAALESIYDNISKVKEAALKKAFEVREEYAPIFRIGVIRRTKSFAPLWRENRALYRPS